MVWTKFDGIADKERSKPYQGIFHGLHSTMTFSYFMQRDYMLAMVKWRSYTKKCL